MNMCFPFLSYILMRVLNSELSSNFYLTFFLILLSPGATHHMIMCLILYLLTCYKVPLEMCYRMVNSLVKIRSKMVIQMVLKLASTLLISRVPSRETAAAQRPMLIRLHRLALPSWPGTNRPRDRHRIPRPHRCRLPRQPRLGLLRRIVFSTSLLLPV